MLKSHIIGLSDRTSASSSRSRRHEQREEWREHEWRERAHWRWGVILSRWNRGGIAAGEEPENPPDATNYLSMTPTGLFSGAEAWSAVARYTIMNQDSPWSEAAMGLSVWLLTPLGLLLLAVAIVLSD